VRRLRARAPGYAHRLPGKTISLSLASCRGKLCQISPRCAMEIHPWVSWSYLHSAPQGMALVPLPRKCALFLLGRSLCARGVANTVSDGACRALTACQDPVSIDIRHREIEKLRVLMQRSCPSWCDKISAAAPGAGQAALVICAACFGGLNTASRANIRGAVINVLCELHKHHPTYKQFFRNTPLQALSCYKQQ
jgi:hypothetical protein